MPDLRHMERPQWFQDACIELFGTISDMPTGSEVIEGRAFQIVRTELYDLAMDLAGGSREAIEESRAALAIVRAEVKSLGT